MDRVNEIVINPLFTLLSPRRFDWVEWRGSYITDTNVRYLAYRTAELGHPSCPGL
jgi:hypothetical protein